MKIQTKRNNEQYTKTNNESEKAQKRQIIDHYDVEIEKIRKILDTIANVAKLEKEYYN